MAVYLPLFLCLLVMRSLAGITVADRQSHMWQRTEQCLTSQVPMENGREAGSGFWVSDDYALFPEEKEDGGGQVSPVTSQSPPAWPPAALISAGTGELWEQDGQPNSCRQSRIKCQSGGRWSPISAGREFNYQDLRQFQSRTHTSSLLWWAAHLSSLPKNLGFRITIQHKGSPCATWPHNPSTKLNFTSQKGSKNSLINSGKAQSGCEKRLSSFLP